MKGLFTALDHAPRVDPAEGARELAVADWPTEHIFAPGVDERMCDLFARAREPGDPFELRDLYLGRVEHELGRRALRSEHAQRWRDSRPRRGVDATEILNSRATARLVKELFNWFFRDDLYGALRSDSHLILSSGSVDEEAYGLPDVLKDCIRHALDRDWYGYSDSRGRVPAREGVAAYESARLKGAGYNEDNIALTMGGTFAISLLADFVSLRSAIAGPALCAIPGYPPLVEAVARRMDVELVPLACIDGVTSLEPLIARLTPSTPLVLLQTVTNPTGAAVDEAELRRLIEAASPQTIVLLDECHEWLGEERRISLARAARNVVRVSSISKTWSAPGLKIGWFVADADFIAEYYEFASTTFGGPPSIFYTLIEVMTRIERWMLEGVETPGMEHVREFEPTYGLTVDSLAPAYAAYCRDRRARETALSTLRDAAVAGLAQQGVRVMRPRYSINMAVEFAGADDSYRCFRELLADSGVAVFPGILTFCLSGGAVRVTTARTWRDLARAIKALGACS